MDNLLGINEFDYTNLEVMDDTVSVAEEGSVSDKITSSLTGFIKGLKKKAVTNVSKTLRRATIDTVQKLLSSKNYDLAVTVCEEALEKARDLKDQNAVDELGALYAYSLYKAGRLEEAQEALKTHEEDKLPAIENKIKEALAGTEFDPEYKNLLEAAKSIHSKEIKTSEIYGKKPGFLSHFNPFYQVARIKDHMSKKDFHSKMNNLLNKSYKKVAAAQKQIRNTGTVNSFSQKALAQAEKEYNALSSLATDFAENPGTRIADNTVQLFDPSNLFATSQESLYSNVNQLFNAVETADDSFDISSQVRLINDNPTAWMARWHILKNAKKSIDTTYFILDKDLFGMAFLGLLRKKAEQGLSINIMIDGSGVKDFKATFLGQDYMQELLQFENVKIRTFNPYSKNILKLFVGQAKKFMASNHDKIIVVDNQLCMTGGRNIAHHYFVHPDDDETVYLDTDVLIKGKGPSTQLSIAFKEEFERMSNWALDEDSFGNWKERATELNIVYEVMDNFLFNKSFDPIYKKYKDHKDLIDKYVEETSHCPRNQGMNDFVPFLDNRLADVKILDKHSVNDERNDITTAVINAMDACKEEIIIQNPYVVMTKRARAAIVRASRRGVKIIILSNSPDSSDSLLTQAMFVIDWKELLRDAPNCEIWAMKGPNKLHAKTFIFDKKISIVGTYNMDPMSEQINSEVVAMINDEDFSLIHRDSIMTRLENAWKYEIKINSKGQIEEAFGPDSHADKSALRKVKLLSFTKCLRSFI
jgi:phosphatidylserine/phosphatidylglycerophosphate/cardiolipin synthase-like enzyme